MTSNFLEELVRREPMDMTSFTKASRTETKLALITFALQNFRNFEYDLTQTDISLFPSISPMKHRTRKVVFRFKSPAYFVELLENHLSEDWYYKFIVDKFFNDVELVLYPQEAFEKEKRNSTEYAANLSSKAKSFLPLTTGLFESNDRFYGKVFLIKTVNYLSDVERINLYQDYDLFSKNYTGGACLELTSNQSLEDGLYLVELKKRKFIFGDGFEITEAKLLQKSEKKMSTCIPHGHLIPVNVYSQKKFSTRSVLLWNKIKIEGWAGVYRLRYFLFIVFMFILLLMQYNLLPYISQFISSLVK